MKKNIYIALLCLFLSSMLIADGNKSCHSDKKLEEAEKLQELCPVMENPINKEIFTEYKGKKVYFCCKACINLFNKSPEKYLKKIQKSQVDESKDIKQKKCPIMGMDINPEIFTKHDGKKVYFCCSSCVEEFNTDPDKYLKELDK